MEADGFQIGVGLFIIYAFPKFPAQFAAAAEIETFPVLVPIAIDRATFAVLELKISLA